jgi:hypothetical protein
MEFTTVKPIRLTGIKTGCNRENAGISGVISRIELFRDGVK